MGKSRVENRPASERLTLAKFRAAKLVHHIVPLLLMHESNATVIYSQRLSAQIPRSYAAHAFNQFQHSMHLFEIIRLCAIWDKPADDRESIPTIIALFDDPGVIGQLVSEAHAQYATEAPPDGFHDGDNPHDLAAKKAWWKQDRGAFATQIEETIRDKLSFAASKAAEIQKSSEMKSLMNFRHRFIAHNLDLPEPDINDEANVDRPKYGYETRLLEDTVSIADALHHGLNQTSFDWEGSRKIARRNALALWDGCTFQIPTRKLPTNIPGAGG